MTKMRTTKKSPSDCDFPPILDACCGGRQFWFDKGNPDVLFADCRVMPPKVVGAGKDARIRKCLPDRVHDFRAMEYPDETFQMVVFDPPHLFLGENSFMAQSYGRLERETWRKDLILGFSECFRVLKKGGTLIFKWNECDIPLSEILKCTPHKPLFGHPSGKAQKTHWVAFMKKQSNPPPPPAKVSASNSTKLVSAVGLTRTQEKKLRHLIEKGGNHSAVTVHVGMPDGSLADVDPFGRVTWRDR